LHNVFEPIKINQIELANRFVRSATWEGMAGDDGSVSDKLVDTMAVLAKGGVGLIIPGHIYVKPEGKATPWQTGIDKDELVPGLKKLTDAVHSNGSKVVAQISHAGNFTSEAITGQTPVVVSDFDGVAKEPRKELSETDIQDVIDAFTQAARRAKEAGFDGVQLHSAHGYLLSQFLSPQFNRRKDNYGGAIENKARIHLEIYQAIRKVVGSDFPIIMKINGTDGTKSGLALEESVQVGKLMADSGLDAIEVSGGPMPTVPEIDSEDKEAFFRPQAKAFKDALDIPIILIGGVRSLNVAERLLDEGTVDMISMARPFIREPNLVNRWKGGDEEKAACISCNGCMMAGMEGNGIYCVAEHKKK